MNAKLILAALLVSMSLAACGKKEEPAEMPAPAEEAPPAEAPAADESAAPAEAAPAEAAPAEGAAEEPAPTP